jgi:hypothetical protein
MTEVEDPSSCVELLARLAAVIVGALMLASVIARRNHADRTIP